MLENFIIFINNVLNFEIMGIDIFTFLMTISIATIILEIVKSIAGGKK